jgi:membrane carboxypeptidase/penicillin-binding protein
VLKRVVRIVVRGLLAIASIVVLLIAVLTGWLFFYTADLPNIKALSTFAPDAPTNIADAYICGEKAAVVAVPTSQVTDVRNALFAAEGEADPRSMASRLYDEFLGEPGGRKHYGSYSLQVSRQLFCDHRGRMLKRELSELRTSVQLERRFTTSQLLDIYLNRVYFGPGVYGIESAAKHFLAKPAIQLSTPEAAFLIGLIKNPQQFSPQVHPERALARRNEVIDTMAKRGSISFEQAEDAKRMPLGIVTDGSAKHRL